MAWSTRELADLSGTTVDTVQHYHREGLLDEPDRMPNGDKHYQVGHLLRLLQIRRLRDLGVPLGQINEFGPNGPDSSTALLAVDADLATTIERLELIRADITEIVKGQP